MLLEKKHSIAGVQFSYYDGGNNQGKTLVFLHGWGADKDNLRAIFSNLEETFRIISIDLPGFGQSTRPTETWGSPEYAKIISELLLDIGIERYSLFGHSFGGKIAFLIAHNNIDCVEKLILMGANIIRTPHGFSWYCKVGSYKIMKWVYKFFIRDEVRLETMKSRFGSQDYKDSVFMRDILIKEVNEDYTNLLKDLSVPTFLYWGESDDATPLWMGRKINKLLPDAGIFVVKNGSHYPFLQDCRIIDILKSFIS